MKTPPGKTTTAANRLRAFTLALLILLAIKPHVIAAQVADTLSINKKRLRIVTIGAGAAYTGSLVGLSQLWYKNSERQSFRFFNDNAEWKQVDKVGHFYSAFYLSSGTAGALRWCNVPARRSDLAGALTGFLILLPIEIFDGFSADYGASAGDLLANGAGAAFFLGQQVWWKQPRVIPKMSFHRTGFAKLRPEVLGETVVSEFVKDYNGQTYWLSVDMDKFITFPRWLNLAIGYGAHEMVYARDGQNLSAGYNAYRQFYVSPDIDLSAIRTRSKLVRTLLRVAGAIKIPAPAIEFSRKQVAFHGLYF